MHSFCVLHAHEKDTCSSTYITYAFQQKELGIEIKKFLTRHLPDTYAGAHQIAVT